MTLQSIRQRMAAREADLAESEVVIAAPSASGTFDRTTGTYVGASSGAEVYSGRAQVRAANQGADVNLVGVDVHQADWVVKVPASVEGLAVDQLVTIVSSPDADLVGRTFRVAHVGGNDFDPVTRLLVREDSP